MFGSDGGPVEFKFVVKADLILVDSAVVVFDVVFDFELPSLFFFLLFIILVETQRILDFLETEDSHIFLYLHLQLFHPLLEGQGRLVPNHVPGDVAFQQGSHDGPF